MTIIDAIQARYPTPDTNKLKISFSVVDIVTKKFIVGTQNGSAAKFIEHSVAGMQSAVLLRSAMNKLEAYGSDAATRIKKDKGGALMSTIRATRAKFADLSAKFQKLQKELKDALPPSERPDVLVEGLRALYEFDMAASFTDRSDLMNNATYIDLLSHQMVIHQETLRQQAQLLEPLFIHMQLGGKNDWKRPLSAETPLKEVEMHFKKTLDTLNGSELRTVTNKFLQAPNDLWVDFVFCFFADSLK